MIKVENDKLMIDEKEFEQINDKDLGVVYDTEIVLDSKDSLLIEKLDMALMTMDSMQQMHMKIAAEYQKDRLIYQGVMMCVQSTQAFMAKADAEIYNLYEENLNKINTNFKELNENNLGVVIEKASNKLFITQGGK